MVTTDNQLELTSLPNIGKVLAERLMQAGIATPDDLRAIGSKNAFICIKTIDSGACLSMLYALEGAVQNIRWHDLDVNKKSQLKTFYNLTNT